MLKTCIHKDIYIGYNASYTSVISWEKLSSISFFGRAMISVHPCSGILWIHVHIGLLILLVASGYLYRKSSCCIRGNLPKLSHMPKMQMHLQYRNVQHMHTNILIYEYYLFNTSNSLGFLNKCVMVTNWATWNSCRDMLMKARTKRINFSEEKILSTHPHILWAVCHLRY